MQQRFSVFYFSGTGNTWWAAKTLVRALVKHKHSAVCYSIEEMDTARLHSILSHTNHIILGFPVYGSDMPAPMKDFIESMPLGNHRRLSIFATQALGSGDTAYHAGCFLRKKEYRLMQTRHFRTMNNLHLPMFRFYPPDNGEKLASLLSKTSVQIEAFAAELESPTPCWHGRGFTGNVLGSFQRAGLPVMQNLFQKELKIEKGLCRDCGLCQHICPVQNIEKQNGAYQFKGNCALCLRCYSQCPTSAILVGKKSIDTKRYPRFKGPSGFLQQCKKYQKNDGSYQ